MKPRIIFMGTPDFAVPSLRILVENGYPVVAVITATDKLGGRGGKQLLQPAVKQYAIDRGIPVLQPKNLKAPDFVENLRSFNADLQIVVAFRMLPKIVWDMPPMGTFNLHGSLLPKYRGAAPINWAILQGEKETGVTTFFIQQEIDTGDLLYQARTPIGPDETAGEVHDRLMVIGAQLVLRTVQAIERGDAQALPQDDSSASPAPKLFKDNTRIDFDQPTQRVHDFVRGLSPYPAAWAELEGRQWKILRTRMMVADHDCQPGQILTDGHGYLRIACTDGFLEVDELQVEGKRRMKTGDFLNGWRAEEEVMVLT